MIGWDGWDGDGDGDGGIGLVGMVGMGWVGERVRNMNIMLKKIMRSTEMALTA